MSLEAFIIKEGDERQCIKQEKSQEKEFIFARCVGQLLHLMIQQILYRHVLNVIILHFVDYHK